METCYHWWNVVIFRYNHADGRYKKARIQHVLEQRASIFNAYFSTTDRYEQIRKLLHFTDQDNENQDDSLRKLRVTMEYLIARFKTNYIPEEEVAIDEYLSL